MKRLGEKIRTLRQNRALTQEQLADMLEVSRAHVSRLETGTKTPTLEAVVKIGHIFGVTTDQLLHDELEVDEAPPYLFGPGYKKSDV